jgi:hypothetical protein
LLRFDKFNGKTFKSTELNIINQAELHFLRGI